jgi:hypothetical protein
LQDALEKGGVRNFLAFKKIQADNFAGIKGDLLETASFQVYKTEIAILKPTIIKVGLLPVAFYKLAAFKDHFFK